MKLLVTIVFLIISIAAADCSEKIHWGRFRGNDCSGIADGYALPSSISPDTNVLWTIKIPSGNSSPCIAGKYLFITASSNDLLLTFCIDRLTGAVLWQREIKPEVLEKPSRLAGLASPTPTTDGSYIYVYFGSYGLICYDFKGNEIWKKQLPIPNTQHGTGSSPVLCDDRLILLRDQDKDSYLLAVDKLSGKTVWKADRPMAKRGFSTPLVVREKENDNPIIVVAGTLTLMAYDSMKGDELWRVGGLPNEVCASPIQGSGLLYAAGWTPWSGATRLQPFDILLQQGDKNGDGKISADEAPSGQVKQHFIYADADKDGFITKEEWEELSRIFSKSENSLIAVRPGDRSQSNQKDRVVWKQTRGLPYVPTPLYYREKLWLIKNGGLLTCYKADDGEILIREERIGAGGDYYSSPAGGDGKIYICSQQGVVTVIKAEPPLQVISQNPFNEQIFASPAIVEGIIYLRTSARLYAFKVN